MPTPTRPARLTALTALGALAAGGVLLLAGPASAHVSITPDTASAGGSTEVTFRVPNEEATAVTDRVDILLPADHPIPQVLVRPTPGWTVTTRTVRLDRPVVTDDGRFTSAVSEVIWSGGRIAPGQYQDFSLSLDPLPDEATTLVFKALQTYSDGDVVRWIDVPTAGQDEPEHPAPTLTLTTSTLTTATGARTADVEASSAAVTDGSSAPSWSGGLAVAGLAVAVVALGLAGWAARRRG